VRHGGDLPAFLDRSDGSLEVVVIVEVIMVNDGLSKWGCCIHVNGPTAERVHDGYKEGEEAFPIQRSHVGGVYFHSGVSIAHCRRFDAVIVKQMASDAAALAEIGLSSQIRPDQGIQRMPSSPRCKGAHLDPSPEA
jgi:hypothetical protein